MDLIKEITDVRKAIEDALEDGKIGPIEAFKIAREIIDVLAILLPLLTRVVCEKAESEK